MTGLITHMLFAQNISLAVRSIPTVWTYGVALKEGSRTNRLCSVGRAMDVGRLLEDKA